MSRRMFLFSLVLCLALPLNIATSQEEHKEFWHLVQTINDILAGKDVDHAKSCIAHGARLVDGARFVDLEGALTGNDTTVALADTSYQGVMIQGRTNPSEDMGFLILKTVKSDKSMVRFHTVVFLKDSTGEFKIECWHASGDKL